MLNWDYIVKKETFFSNINIKSLKWNNSCEKGIIRCASDREKSGCCICFFKPDGHATALGQRIDGAEKTDVLLSLALAAFC